MDGLGKRDVVTLISCVVSSICDFYYVQPYIFLVCVNKNIVDRVRSCRPFSLINCTVFHYEPIPTHSVCCSSEARTVTVYLPVVSTH